MTWLHKRARGSRQDKGTGAAETAAQADVDKAQRQLADAKQRHDEAMPVVSAAKRSLTRNNYGETVVAALRPRKATS